MLVTDATGTPQWKNLSEMNGLSQTLSEGYIFVGSNQGVAVGVPVSGDLAIASSGAVAIAEGAVDSLAILDGSVDVADLKSDAVTSTKIAAGAVSESKITANAVSSTKIAADAVNSAKIADLSVTADDIANLAVTTTKLADGSVTPLKLAQAAVPTQGQVLSWDTVQQKFVWLDAATGDISNIVGGNGLSATESGGSVTVNADLGAGLMFDGSDAVAVDFDGVTLGTDGSGKLTVLDSSITIEKLALSGAAANGKVLAYDNGDLVWTAAANGTVTSVGVGDGLVKAGTATEPILSVVTDDATIVVNGNGKIAVKSGGIGEQQLATAAVTAVKLDATAAPTDKQVLSWDQSAGKMAWKATSSLVSEQNTFERVRVSGQSDIVAGSATDSLLIAAGENVTLVTDAATKTLTISSVDTNTTYTAGNGLLLSGTVFGLSTTGAQEGQVLKYVGGIPVWGSSGAGAGFTGGGNAGKVALWQDASTLIDSALSQVGGNIGIGVATPGARLDVAGGAQLAGPLVMSNNRITGLAEPLNTSDAVTKSYVDEITADMGSGDVTGITAGTGIAVDNPDTPTPTVRLQDYGVDTLQLQNGAVKTVKIYTGAVTGEKLAPNLELSQNLTFTGANVGVGVSAPQSRLQVGGAVTAERIVLTDGAQDNYVLTSDANGVAAWKSVTTVGGGETNTGANVGATGVGL
jgi:hypothetical protein